MLSPLRPVSPVYHATQNQGQSPQRARSAAPSSKEALSKETIQAKQQNYQQRVEAAKAQRTESSVTKAQLTNSSDRLQRVQAGLRKLTPEKVKRNAEAISPPKIIQHTMRSASAGPSSQRSNVSANVPQDSEAINGVPKAKLHEIATKNKLNLSVINIIAKDLDKFIKMDKKPQLKAAANEIKAEVVKAQHDERRGELSVNGKTVQALRLKAGESYEVEIRSLVKNLNPIIADPESYISKGVAAEKILEIQTKNPPKTPLSTEQKKAIEVLTRVGIKDLNAIESDPNTHIKNRYAANMILSIQNGGTSQVSDPLAESIVQTETKAKKAAEEASNIVKKEHAVKSLVEGPLKLSPGDYELVSVDLNGAKTCHEFAFNQKNFEPTTPEQVISRAQNRSMAIFFDDTYGEMAVAHSVKKDKDGSWVQAFKSGDNVNGETVIFKIKDLKPLENYYKKMAVYTPGNEAKFKAAWKKAMGN